MKKYFIFISVIIVGIFFYIFLIKSPSSYELLYDKDGFSIKEKYISEIDSYSFLLTKDKKNYPFAIKHKYSKKRRLIDQISEVKEGDTTCVSIKVFDNGISPICNNQEHGIFDKNILINEDAELIKTKSSIDIYNDKHVYYIWNGYGVTDLMSGKKYNVLKNESYDNSFSYSLNNKILFGNYDDEYKYSKLYIFDMEENEYSEIDLDSPIDKDSYILGDYANLIYIFDKKNSKEYSINLDAKEIDVVSNNDGGLIYIDGIKKNIPLVEIKYNTYTFNDKNLSLFTVDKNLYMSYYGSDNKIKVSNKEVKYITQVNNDTVYYISNDSLYKYTYNDKEQKLLTNFEWNFSFENKVFVYYK